ncbi:MAG: class I SAM-dependent methyltransferase [Deltaproteobacteria bacterium]|nr:class I SAM-dependent methyltransferase [Deltaproteobacteria bacterium]
MTNRFELIEKFCSYEPILRLGAKLLTAWRYMQTRRKIDLQRLWNFWNQLSTKPIDLFEDEANQQHYEQDLEFFTNVLGKRMKYSCCYFENSFESLDAAEERMLGKVCDLIDWGGVKSLLDIGCGWGSLLSYLVDRGAHVEMHGLTNSCKQYEFVRDKLGKHGVKVHHSSFGKFRVETKFDLVTCVEMLEHIQNWKEAFKLISSFLNKSGVFVIHFFATHAMPYIYEPSGWADWMSREFFTGGLMPSPIFLTLQQDFALEYVEYIPGIHYKLTADRWIENLNKAWYRLLDHLVKKGMSEGGALRQLNKWKMFFVGCSEFFGFKNGEIFGVYLAKLRKCD